MNNPELFVITVNAVVIVIAYFLIYPRFCGANGYKIAVNDVMATAIPLLITGLSFWGSGISFSILIATVNWFWFTLITYFLMEIPFMLWYFRKYNIWDSL